MVPQVLQLAQELRQEGHVVETVLCLREHVDYVRARLGGEQ